MYCWMQELHEKNFTNAESSDSHEKNEKAQKTKKKAIFTIRGGFFSPVKKKKNSACVTSPPWAVWVVWWSKLLVSAGLAEVLLPQMGQVAPPHPRLM